MGLKEYPERKIWTFTKLRKGNKISRFFKNLFTSECPECKTGRLSYIGDDWTGKVWIGIYECNECKKEFV